MPPKRVSPPPSAEEPELDDDEDAEEEDEDDAEEEGDEDDEEAEAEAAAPSSPPAPPPTGASSPHIHSKATHFQLWTADELAKWKKGDRLPPSLTNGTEQDGSARFLFPVDHFAIPAIRQLWGAGEYFVLSLSITADGVRRLGDPRRLPVPAEQDHAPPLRGAAPAPSAVVRPRTVRVQRRIVPGTATTLTMPGHLGDVPVDPRFAELLRIQEAVAHQRELEDLRFDRRVELEVTRIREREAAERREREAAAQERTRLELEREKMRLEHERKMAELALERERLAHGDEDDEDDEDEEEEEQPEKPAAPDGTEAPEGAAAATNATNIHVEPKGWGEQLDHAGSGAQKIADSVEKAIMALPEGLRVLASAFLEQKAAEIKAKVTGQAAAANGVAS